MEKHGLLIAVEGIDGCGKSTLARTLYDQLKRSRYDVVLTKEPGDSALGKQIRTIVQEQTVPICAKAEYLLFAADRAQHRHDVLAPALHCNRIVISDRMGDSSIVYQGYARGLEIDMIKQVNNWALEERLPDVTLFVELDPAVARERFMARSSDLSAFEREQGDFLQKLHNGFCTLYKDRKDVIHIDGTQDPDSLAHQAYTALLPWLKPYEHSI